MNLLDDIKQPAEASDYHFADGDLTSFQEEFSKPKQDMGITIEPDRDLFPDNEEQPDNGGVTPAVAARSTGRFLARITDQGAAFGLSLISKNPVEEHKADKDGFRELENILIEYCKETGGNIPLWAQLLICLVTLYGFQIPKALEDRKLNKEREALEHARKALENERLLYETKRLELEQNAKKEEPKEPKEPKTEEK